MKANTFAPLETLPCQNNNHANFAQISNNYMNTEDKIQVNLYKLIYMDIDKTYSTLGDGIFNVR